MTRSGPIGFERRVHACDACGKEFAPVDRALGARGACSGRVVELTLLLVADMPGARAVERLKTLGGITVSAATADRLKQRLGAEVRTELEAEEAEWLRPVSPERPGPKGLDPAPKLISRQADGAMIRFRGEGWKEVKAGMTVGLGAQDAALERPDVAPARYCATRQGVEALGRSLQTLSLQQGLRRAGASQFLSDAGPGMDAMAQGPMSQSERTLDCIHAGEHVGMATAALDGQGTEAAKERFGQLSRLLLEPGGNAQVRAALGQAAGGRPPEARREVHKAIAYLERYEAHTNYHDLRQRGWPIGSGRIEGGGCKLYLQQRFKGPGMSWSLEGFARLEALRRISFNDRWDILHRVLYHPERHSLN